MTYTRKVNYSVVDKMELWLINASPEEFYKRVRKLRLERWEFGND